MLKLDQRPSGIWRIRGTHHGHRVDQSARTRDKAEAKKIKEKWEAEIVAKAYGFIKDTKHYTFAHAAEIWLLGGGDSTLYHYYDRILLRMGDIPLTDLTPGMIDRIAGEIFPTQKNSTINRGYYALISVILNCAVREEWISPIYIKKRKVKRSRINWHTPETIETLIAAAGDMAPLLTFFIGTGARTSEVMRLEWRDVSLDNQRVTFWTTKGGRPRSVDLCNRTKAALPPRTDGRVWVKQDGQAWSETADGRFYGPRQRLKRICQNHDLPDIGLHSLRHSWASWQYAINPDPLSLQIKGGWASLAMVLNYAHLATNDLAQSVKNHGWFENEIGQNLGNFKRL